MNIKERLQTIIYEWVKKNFGESEADEPSWSIEALAEELADNFHLLFWEQELEYVKEDVERYAKEHDYNLNEKQAYAIADDIRNADWYCSIEAEDMEFHIEQELKRGERNVNYN